MNLIILLILFNNNKLFSREYAPEVYSACSSGIFDEIKLNNNPALLSSNQSNSVLLSYSPSRFGLSELSVFELSLNFKLNNNSGIKISDWGLLNDLYSDFNFSCSYGLNIGSQLSIGVDAEYEQLKVKNYSINKSYRINTGFILKLSESLRAGLLMKNITGSRIGGVNNSINKTAIIGINYNLIQDLEFDMNGIIRINNNSAFSSSMKYKLNDYLGFRIAWLTYPQTLEFAASIKPMNNFIFGLIAAYNFDLGLSKTMTLIYSW